MNALLEAAYEIQAFLHSHSVPSVLIGGIAVQRWGEPRATGDVDCTISVPLGEEGKIAGVIVQRFAARVSEPIGFAERHRILLVSAGNGIPIDISLAMPGYEEEMFARAVAVDTGEGRSLRICTPEDLVVQKVFAGRARDLDDARSVLTRQRGCLDLDYIRKWLGNLDSALGSTENISRLERLLVPPNPPKPKGAS